MGPGERVMIVGNSREPFTCAKKDEKALMSFWSKHIFLPPPDYASRKVSAMFELWYVDLGMRKQQGVRSTECH